MKRLKEAGEARSREARGDAVHGSRWSRTARPVSRKRRRSSTAKDTIITARRRVSIRTLRASTCTQVFPRQIAFFPFEQLETISPRPLLVIAGFKAHTLFWSEDVYKKAKDPKELHIVEGATDIDIYDKPQFVKPAVAKLTAFFGRHLGQAGRSNESVWVRASSDLCSIRGGY